MKSRQLKNALLSAAIIFSMAVTSCSSGNNKNAASSSEDHKEVEAAKSASPSFKDEKVSRIYADYIVLKDALVKSNGEDAGIAAGALQGSLNEVSQGQAADLAGKIASVSSLKSQRESFNALSLEVAKVLAASEISGGAVYKQYCPMANGGDGGYWLANEQAIRNPYYGDEMMTCGSVKEEIK